MNRAPTYRFALAGFAIIVLPRLAWHCYAPRHGFTLEQRLLANLLFAWTVTAALLLLVRYAERRPLGSIGIRPLNADDVRWALFAFGLSGLIMMATMPLVSALGLGTTERGVRRLADLSVWWRLLAIVTAAVTEEIRYRGYPVERLTELTGRLLPSATLAYALFVALHAPFRGWGGTIQIGLASLPLYVLYLRRRNLTACMLAHGLNNTVAFLIVPLALAPER